MKKWIITLLLLVVSNIIFADGKVFKGRDFSSMFPVHENEQRAFIAHKDGREAMVLAVNFDLEDDEKAFWLFPVLGQPQNVEVDLLEHYPRLWGYDPIVEANENINILAGMQFVTQPYLYPFVCLMMPSLGLAKGGIDIHSSIEKDGLRIETLTGDSLESLGAFLQSKGIGVGQSEIQVYESYLNNQYTLVFVSIVSKKELLEKYPNIAERYSNMRGRWPCVYVEFPTEQIFFPLKPTGTYEDPLEINLKVLGYVKPADNISRQSWDYDYYIAKTLPNEFPQKLTAFIESTPVRYTRIEFFGEAHLLKNDLYLAPAEIQGVKYAESILMLSDFDDRTTLIIIYVVITAAQSWFCAGLSGRVLKKKWLPYANLGFGNLGTLVCVHFAAKYGSGFFESDLKGNESKSQRSKFIWLFAFFFVLSSVLLQIILRIPFIF